MRLRACLATGVVSALARRRVRDACAGRRCRAERCPSWSARPPERRRCPPAAQLQVRATDPDDAQVDVTFHAQAHTPGTPGTGDPFTLMLMPDTQNYVSTTANTDIMRQQAQWIADNKDPLNIAFVAHLGDIVGVETATVQWERASQYLAILDAANVPSAVLPGQPRHEPDHRVGRALPAVLPGQPVRERDVELADGVLRRLLRPGPVRRRPGGPAEPRQLLPVHRGRHGLPAAQPRVQRPRLRRSTGRGGCWPRTRTAGRSSRRTATSTWPAD